MQARPIEGGTISKQKRWMESKYSVTTPGVGEYNLIPFKGIAKASGTSF